MKKTFCDKRKLTSILGGDKGVYLSFLFKSQWHTEIVQKLQKQKIEHETGMVRIVVLKKHESSVRKLTKGFYNWDIRGCKC